jgi:hypothetical protein
MENLKQMTYALGEGVPNPPKSKIKRPRRAPRRVAPATR